MEAAINKYQACFIHIHFLAQAIRLLFQDRLKEPHIYRLTGTIKSPYSVIIKLKYKLLEKVMYIL